MEKYLEKIRLSLINNLNLVNIYSNIFDKIDSKAIIFKNDNLKNKYNINKEFEIIKKTNKEQCKFETSIDSIRVSLKVKLLSKIDNIIFENIYQKYIKQYQIFDILQKIPIDKYDITFLITNKHLDKYNKELLIEWIIKFIYDLHIDIQNIQISLSNLVKSKIDLINNTIFSKLK